MQETCLRARDLTSVLVDTGHLSPAPTWSREFCIAIARQYYGRDGRAADVADLGERLLTYCRALAIEVKTEGQRYYEAAHTEVLAEHPGDTYAPWEALTPDEQQTQEECARVASIAMLAYRSAHESGEPDTFELDRWNAATEFVIRTWLSLGLNSKDCALRTEAYLLAAWIQGNECIIPVHEERQQWLIATIVETLARVTTEFEGAGDC